MALTSLGTHPDIQALQCSIQDMNAFQAELGENSPMLRFLQETRQEPRDVEPDPLNIHNADNIHHGYDYRTLRTAMQDAWIQGVGIRMEGPLGDEEVRVIGMDGRTLTVAHPTDLDTGMEEIERFARGEIQEYITINRNVYDGLVTSPRAKFRGGHTLALRTIIPTAYGNVQIHVETYGEDFVRLRLEMDDGPIQDRTALAYDLLEAGRKVPVTASSYKHFFLDNPNAKVVGNDNFGIQIRIIKEEAPMSLFHVEGPINDDGDVYITRMPGIPGKLNQIVEVPFYDE